MGSGGAVPAQGGLPDRASSGSDCWDWEKLAGVGERVEDGEGLCGILLYGMVGFLCSMW